MKFASVVIFRTLMEGIYTASNTLMEVIPTLSSPRYVWPLTNLTYNYEVKGSRAGNYNQCGFHFGGKHPSFVGAPLQLDGDKYPYIDIYIDDTTGFKSFSFALFVNISSSFGCIFHFKSSQSVNVITDVSVCVNRNSLTMEFKTSSGSSRLQLSLWIRGQWTMVQVGQDSDNGNMAFNVRNDYSSAVAQQYNTFGSKRLGLPGTLRIGARHDTTMALSLTATCVTMYDVTINAGSGVTEIENQCQSPPSVSGLPINQSAGCPVSETTRRTTVADSTPHPTTTENASQESRTSTNDIETTSFETSDDPITSTPQCTRTDSDSPGQRSGSFTRTVKDIWFTDSTNLIATLRVNSKRQCADVCLTDTQCMSFLFERVDIGPSVCSMYSTFTSHSVVKRLNSNLYVLKCH